MTHSEKRIVRHLLLGWSDRKIASEFNLSAETVKRHVQNIMDETGMSTRVEIINHVMCNAFLLNRVYETNQSRALSK